MSDVACFKGGPEFRAKRAQPAGPQRQAQPELAEVEGPSEARTLRLQPARLAGSTPPGRFKASVDTVRRPGRPTQALHSRSHWPGTDSEPEALAQPCAACHGPSRSLPVTG